MQIATTLHFIGILTCWLIEKKPLNCLFRQQAPKRLASEGEGTEGPTIIGDVFIHRFEFSRRLIDMSKFTHSTATVHPSAVLGPNVSVGRGVQIGAGARVRESILLGNSTLGEHSLVIYSVIGWSSSVGAWARVEGTPDDPNPNKPFAKMENSALFNNSGQLNPSITILGSNVAVPGEV